MALPKERVQLSTFHGGMAPDLGQVVGGLPETAELLINVDIDRDGSIRHRKSFVDKRVDTIHGINVDIEEGYYSGVGTAIARDLSGNQYLLNVSIADAATDNIVVQQAAIPGNNLAGISTNALSLVGFRNQGDFRVLRHTNKTRFSMDQFGNIQVYNPHFDAMRITPDTTGFFIFVSDPVPKVRVGGVGDIVDVFPTGNYLHRRFSVGLHFGSRQVVAGDGAARNRVYISKVVGTTSNAYTEFYVEDPVNPVATDGGTIDISEAELIYGLAEFRGGILVIANNGLWHIRSPREGSFDPQQFTITRLSELGSIGEDSWTVVDDNIVFLTEAGLATLVLHESGEFITQYLGQGKIDERYRNIDRFHKQAAGLIYDRPNNQLILSINDPNLHDASSSFDDYPIDDVERKRNPNAMFAHNRHMYIYDLQTGAWRTYVVGDGADAFSVQGSWGVAGSMKLLGRHTDTYKTNPEQEHTLLVMQRSRQTSLSAAHFVALAVFANITPPRDLPGLVSSTRNHIRSTVLSHPYTFDNLSNKKLIHFLHMALGRVEAGITVGGVDVNPGAIRLTVGWDWFKPGASTHPKARQVYNPYRWTETTFGGFDQNKPVIKDKFKLPGRGTAVQLLIENREVIDATTHYRDFHLKGWQIEVKGSTRR